MRARRRLHSHADRRRRHSSRTGVKTREEVEKAPEERPPALHFAASRAQMEEDALESSSEEGSSLDEPSWVSWFCMLRNHEFFCEVDPAFVQDRFNLYGLKEIVGPLYGEAMTMILGYAPTGALVHQCSRLTPHWGASGPAPGLLCEQDGAVSSGRRALACSTRTLRLRCSCLCRTQRSSCPTRRSASTRYWRPRASSTG